MKIVKGKEVATRCSSEPEIQEPDVCLKPTSEKKARKRDPNMETYMIGRKITG